jgi:hypothetical protein
MRPNLPVVKVRLLGKISYEMQASANGKIAPLWFLSVWPFKMQTSLIEHGKIHLVRSKKICFFGITCLLYDI